MGTLLALMEIHLKQCSFYGSLTQKGSRPLIWGVISSNDTAGLFFLLIKTTINSGRYCKMLEDKLKIHMAIHDCNMLMQDSVACPHLQFMSAFLKNIKTLHWPGNSPDLNPIENSWAILKDKLADEHPTSVKDL